MTVTIYDTEKQDFIGQYDNVWGIEIIQNNLSFLNDNNVLNIISLKPTHAVRAST